MANEKNVITKSDWVSNFTLIGEAKVNDYTFKIDEHSNKSSWIYNSMNLGIDCGEKFGTVFADLMGGYSEDRENIIYVHGKDENGNNDFGQTFTVDWEDRLNDEVLESVGDLCFITVGLEKTTTGKTYYKNFLSAYDAIAYAQEHLEDGMVVNVRGRLQYSIYNDNVQVRKTIQSIVLSNVDDSSKYVARFTQSVLLDKDSASLKDVDKDKGVMYVNARVLDYLKELNGVEIRGQYPYNVTFEFPMDLTKPDTCKKIYEKLFKVKKNVRQVTFEGEFVEGGAVVQTSWEDVPDDIKDLVEIGVYSKEEALQKCSANGSRERRMLLKKPHIKLVGDDKTPVVQVFDDKYTEDELIIDTGAAEDDEEELPFDEDKSSNESSDDDSMSWLDEL
jgi:hypothetical protein